MKNELLEYSQMRIFAGNSIFNLKKTKNDNCITRSWICRIIFRADGC